MKLRLLKILPLFLLCFVTINAPITHSHASRFRAMRGLLAWGADFFNALPNVLNKADNAAIDVAKAARRTFNHKNINSSFNLGKETTQLAAKIDGSGEVIFISGQKGTIEEITELTTNRINDVQVKYPGAEPLPSNTISQAEMDGLINTVIEREKIKHISRAVHIIPLDTKTLLQNEDAGEWAFEQVSEAIGNIKNNIKDEISNASIHEKYLLEAQKELFLIHIPNAKDLTPESLKKIYTSLNKKLKPQDTKYNIIIKSSDAKLSGLENFKHLQAPGTNEEAKSINAAASRSENSFAKNTNTLHIEPPTKKEIFDFLKNKRSALDKEYLDDFLAMHELNGLDFDNIDPFVSDSDLETIFDRLKEISNGSFTQSDYTNFLKELYETKSQKMLSFFNGEKSAGIYSYNAEIAARRMREAKSDLEEWKKIAAKNPNGFESKKEVKRLEQIIKKQEEIFKKETLLNNQITKKFENIIHLKASDAENHALADAVQAYLKIDKNEAFFHLSHNMKKPMADILENQTSKKIQKVMEFLEEKVYGNSAYKNAVRNAYKNILADPNGKPQVIFVAGDPGSGKTSLAEWFGHAVKTKQSPNNNLLLKVDMAQLNTEEAVRALSGPAPGFVGRDSHFFLRQLFNSDKEVLVLLDEFEKAHQNAFSFFLPLFEGKKVDSLTKDFATDMRGRIVIITSNLFKDVDKKIDKSMLITKLKMDEKASYNMDTIVKPFADRIPYWVKADPISDGALKHILKRDLDAKVLEFKNDKQVTFEIDEKYLEKWSKNIMKSTTEPSGRDASHAVESINATIKPQIEAALNKGYFTTNDSGIEEQVALAVKKGDRVRATPINPDESDFSKVQFKYEVIYRD